MNSQSDDESDLKPLFKTETIRTSGTQAKFEEPETDTATIMETAAGQSTSAQHSAEGGEQAPLTAASALTVRPPRSFAGERGEDFHSWIGRMEKYFALAKTPDEHKLEVIMLYLEKKAFRAAENMKLSELPYNEAKQKLLDYFSPAETVEELRVQFMQRRQGAEPIEVFGRDVRLLAARAYPTLDTAGQEAVAINQFIAGLRTPVTAQRIFMKQCTTFSEAMNAAKLSEAAFHIRYAATPVVPARCGNLYNIMPLADDSPVGNRVHSGGPNTQIRSAARRQTRHEPSRCRSAPTLRDMSAIRCYGCNQFGHMKKDCPNANRNTNV